MAEHSDIIAEVEFLPHDHGGLRLPPPSGIRRQFYYAGEDWDAEFQFLGKGEAPRRTLVRAGITFLSPHEHDGRLQPGLPFLVREGQRVVGYGVVREITGLADSARHMREYLHRDAAS